MSSRLLVNLLEKVLLQVLILSAVSSSLLQEHFLARQAVSALSFCSSSLAGFTDP
jgi:hypothetical protein